jgi:hypothetical protein
VAQTEHGGEHRSVHAAEHCAKAVVVLDRPGRRIGVRLDHDDRVESAEVNPLLPSLTPADLEWSDEEAGEPATRADLVGLVGALLAQIRDVKGEIGVTGPLPGEPLDVARF